MSVSLQSFQGHFSIYNAHRYSNELQSLAPLKVKENFTIAGTSSTILKGSTVYISTEDKKHCWIVSCALEILKQLAATFYLQKITYYIDTYCKHHRIFVKAPKAIDDLVIQHCGEQSFVALFKLRDKIFAMPFTSSALAIEQHTCKLYQMQIGKLGKRTCNLTSKIATMNGKIRFAIAKIS